MNELDKLQKKWDKLETRMTTLECAVLKSRSVNAADQLAAMQARIEKLTEYPARLQKAIIELEAMASSPAFTEKARILIKIEGVKLALSYFEEMTK